MNVSITLNPSTVVKSLSRSECFEWIRDMDNQVAEYDFTLKLAKHFIQVIKDEIEGDDSTTLLKELGL